MILSRRVLLAGLALSGTKAPAFAQSAPEPQMIPAELIEILNHDHIATSMAM